MFCLTSEMFSQRYYTPSEPPISHSRMKCSASETVAGGSVRRWVTGRPRSSWTPSSTVVWSVTSWDSWTPINTDTRLHLCSVDINRWYSTKLSLLQLCVTGALTMETGSTIYRDGGVMWEHMWLWCCKLCCKQGKWWINTLKPGSVVLYKVLCFGLLEPLNSWLFKLLDHFRGCSLCSN